MKLPKGVWKAACVAHGALKGIVDRAAVGKLLKDVWKVVVVAGHAAEGGLHGGGR